MKPLVSAYNFVIVALAVVAGAAIAAAFMFIVYDVSVRALGYRPPAFTGAVVEYILLYFALFAAPFLVRQKGHVLIDAVVTRLSGWPRWGMEKLVYTVCIGTALTFAWFGLQLLLEAMQTHAYEDRSIDVPLWVGYAPMPLCFTLVATEFARYLLGIDTLYADRARLVDNV